MNDRLICTIITKNYLAHARVLAESIREYNKDLPPLLVLLADNIDGYIDPSKETFQLIQLKDLNEQQAIHHMIFYYTPFELCCALKGFLHDYILTRTEAKSWIYLDSDILVTSDLKSVFEQIEANSIVLTPHITSPAKAIEIESVEVCTLNAGLYNAGFLGLHRTEETIEFISWYRSRLQWFCFANQNRIFVDQTWLNYVPLFFKGTSLLKEPGINLGHWKLRGRSISKGNESGFMIDGTPIYFVHFTGWDPDKPDKISKYYPGLDIHNCPGWMEIAMEYAERLRFHGYSSVSKFPYAFSNFDDGHHISTRHRLAYFNSIITQSWVGNSPFRNSYYFIWNVYRNRPLLKRIIKTIKEIFIHLSNVLSY